MLMLEILAFIVSEVGFSEGEQVSVAPSKNVVLVDLEHVSTEGSLFSDYDLTCSVLMT